MHCSPSSEFWSGARDTIPVIVGAVPFGIIFGALAINAGLPVWATLGMSLFVYAGSAQFVAAGLVTQGAGVVIIIVTTFIVNLRHALYSASLGPYLAALPQRWLLPLGFWLTDETYAVVVQRYARPDDSPNKHWYQLGSSVAMYTNWQLCTVIGIVAGTRLQGMSNWGLEFALVVTFIGIVVPLLTSLPMVLCAVVAGAVSFLLRDWPNQIGLILGALSGIATAILADAGDWTKSEARSTEADLAELDSSGTESGGAGSGVAESGVTESGVTESGVTESGVTESGVTESGGAGSGGAGSSGTESSDSDPTGSDLQRPPS